MVHSIIEYQKISRRNYQARATMCLVLSGLFAGSVVGDEPPTSLSQKADIPKVFQLTEFEEEYQHRIRNIVAPDGKTLYDKLSQALDSMIREEVYEHGRRRIITALFPKRQQASMPFAQEASWILVRHLIDSGDRQGLVEVLAIDCPKRLGIQTTIEFELAINGGQLSRSVETLCDAFDLCVNDSNRSMIIAALRRGFEPMGIVQKDDKDFARECRQWLSALDYTWVANPEYGLPGEKAPLFIKGPRVDK